MVFEESARLLLNSKDAAAGRIIKAMCRLYLTGEYTELTNPLENAMFDEIAKKAGKEMARYMQTCEKNRQSADKRWHPEKYK